MPSVAPPPQMTSSSMSAVTPPAIAASVATAAPAYPTFSPAAAGHQQPNSLPAIQPSPNSNQQIYYVSERFEEIKMSTTLAASMLCVMSSLRISLIGNS